MNPLELGKHHVSGISVTVSSSARTRHLYLVGQTGSGKSTILENLIAQDLVAGEGVALVDPHGDLSERVVLHIPQNRAKDLIYIDCSDLARPMGINLLADVHPDKRSKVADDIVTAFIHVFGEHAVADRSQEVLRNSLIVLMERKGETLLSVIRLLRDEPYRSSVIQNIHDPLARSYWLDEFSEYDSRFREQVTAPILNKLDACLSHVALRHFLSQSTSSFSIRHAIDRRQIIIVNLSKGQLGATASKFLGALIVSILCQTALSRTDVPEEERTPFHLYADEFQNFATESFGVVLSEARKYGLTLTLAHQHLHQVPQTIQDAVIGNTGTLVAFRLGATDAPLIARHFGIKNPEQLQDLPNYTAYVRQLPPSDPIRINTNPPPAPLRASAEQLIKHSQSHFGRKREDVERQVRRLFRP